jgi:hypothetical protein
MTEIYVIDGGDYLAILLGKSYLLIRVAFHPIGLV